MVKEKLEKIKKKKIVKKKTKQKTIKTHSGLLIIGILAVISVFILVTVSNSGINIQGKPVYPGGSLCKTSNVPYEKVRNYQFCSQWECECNCEKPFPDRKCEYKAKGTTANCPVFTYQDTQVSWQPHWKCE